MKLPPPSRHGREDLPPAPVTAEELLAHLARASKPVSIREIAHGMGLKHPGRRYLPRVIQKLLKNKEIEEIHGGRYRVPAAHSAKPASKQQGESASESKDVQRKPRKPERGGDAHLIEGRFVAHRDGYGFLVPDSPVPGVDGDLFISRGNVEDAMNGDRALARILRRRADGRAEGRIVRIVERENPTIVGLFRYGPHGNVVLPYDIRILHEIVIPPGEEFTPALREKVSTTTHRDRKTIPSMRLPELDGAVVNVEIKRYPKGGISPVGRVVEIIGRPGEIGVDVEIIIRKHHLPFVFPAEAAGEARGVPPRVEESSLEGRRDFRYLPIVTIDGESARDFDDAVHVSPHADGSFELQVHIADVAHYVRRGSALDREARLRGTSVYFPNRAVPMLPVELSNGICSLNPQVDRLVMSVIMEFDRGGRMTHSDFVPGVIRSSERMTYTNVNKVLEGDATACREYASLIPGFHRMKELALLLNKRRNERGSIDFDLPEPVIEFDPEGRMTSIVRSERNIAHRIIEEFMLAANEAVAEFLERRDIASLYRVHEKPDVRKVLEFEELAQAFGYSLGVEDLAERRLRVRHGQVRPPARGEKASRGRMRPMTVSLPASEEIDIRPEHYQQLTAKITGKPEERILSYLMLRSLKQARYAADPLGHFALATQEYTHFTSPIRRYPDLIVHRTLKWALENPGVFQPPAASPRPRERKSIARLGPYARTELEEIASESSEAERRADGAERELMDWKTAQFMEGRLGEEFEALIISVQKFGFFVELVDIFVEGLVGMDRIEEFTGKRCFFNEREHSIVAEPRRAGRGSSGRQVFHLGALLQVRAERIDPFRHRVEFSLV
jgi:ribonuclease R